MSRWSAMLVALALVLPVAALAQEDQEEPQPEKWENVTWYAVVQVDYKPGKQDDAMKLVKEYFKPASESAGNPGPAMVLTHMTGSWDQTLIWHMDRGPAGMEWKTPPEGVAYQKAFAELAGGPEEAKKIGEEYNSYIARTNSYITLQEEALVSSE